MSDRKIKPVFANVYWFPVAAFYAALILPWSVLGQLGWAGAPVGLRSSWGHGHEMLFGFALAVVSGYLLGPRPRRNLLAMLGLWLLARIAFLGWPTSLAAALFDLGFVLALAWQTVPSFLKTAKKWRNKSVGFILLGLLCSAAAFQFALRGDRWVPLPGTVLLEVVLLLSALMFFMGGRLLAPAIAGHMQDKGRKLLARVQPNIEAAVLLLLAVLLLFNLVALEWLRHIEGAVLLACAALALLRMLRWQIWHCFDRADFVALLCGYCWLIIGWALVGCSLLGAALPLSAAFHAITVGALGTLTASIMLRTRMLRCLKVADAWPWAYLVAVPVSIAAVLRLALGMLPVDGALLLAAGLWSLGFLVLFFLLLRMARLEKGRP